MANERITIALPAEDVARLRALAAAGRIPSVAGFVRSAVTWSLKAENDWIKHYEQVMEESGGPLTDVEIEQIDGELAEAMRRAAIQPA